MPSSAKVAHIITLLELGGAQGNTIYTVQKMNAQRFQCSLWSGVGAYWDKEIKKILGPTNQIQFIPSMVREIRPIKDFLAFFQLVKLIKKEKPHIVHTHSSKAGIIGRLAARWAKVPIIIHTFHGFGFHDRQPRLLKSFFIWLERLVGKFTSELIFVSESNLKWATQLNIGNPKNYHLIRSGVPIKSIRNLGLSTNSAQLRRELSIPDKSKIILSIGPFKPQKNLHDFIRVAKQVTQTRPDVHFLIIGDGKLRGSLETLILDLNLVGKVHLPGWRQDISQILSISDIFAMTSLWEGLPRSLVEAMVLGIPSVCYETDGVQDLLSKGGGFLLKQGDVKGMSDTIKKLLIDGPLWSQKSTEAKSLIQEEFDIDFMVKQQEKLYEESLQELDNSPRIN